MLLWYILVDSNDQFRLAEHDMVEDLMDSRT